MALTVIVVERVTAGVRGDLSRWMLQPGAGVFVGQLSATVRDSLWQRLQNHRGAGACVMVSAAANEQGFELRQHGDRSRALIDVDGFALVRLPPLALGPDSRP
jgi:CRISPR-associated protein Cas2